MTMMRNAPCPSPSGAVSDEGLRARGVVKASDKAAAEDCFVPRARPLARSPASASRGPSIETSSTSRHHVPWALMCIILGCRSLSAPVTAVGACAIAPFAWVKRKVSQP